VLNSCLYKGTGQSSFLSYFDLNERSDSSALKGSLNGVFQAGGVIGTLLLPLIADRYGRKKACIVVGSMFHEMG
jgi:hypothetical protein